MDHSGALTSHLISDDEWSFIQRARAGAKTYSAAQPAIPDGWKLVPKEIAAVLQAIIDDFDDGRGYTNLDDELADRARAALVLLAAVPQTAIPDGWQLVPKEPTPEMMQAGFDVRGGHMYGATYRAMLAAAPKPGEPT